MFRNFFRPAAIIGSLPVTLTNGTVADANQVMSDLNFIVNQVNANAAALTNAALTNANNNFSVVQSGVNATSRANFPLAGQVQDGIFNTLTSTLGTNAITARVSAMALPAYATGQIFTFIPSQTNSGAATLNINALGAGAIQRSGQALGSAVLQTGVPVSVIVTAATPVFEVYGNGYYVDPSSVQTLVNKTVLLSGTSLSGFNPGSGGAVTQATNKTTNVTLNTPNGQITMNGASLPANTTVSFSLLNNLVGVNDHVILTISNAIAVTFAGYNLWALASGGGVVIQVRNITAGALAETVVINFAILKGATS